MFNDYDNPSYLKSIRRTHKRRRIFKKLSRADGPALFENSFKVEDRKSGKKQRINDKRRDGYICLLFN